MFVPYSVHLGNLDGGLPFIQVSVFVILIRISVTPVLLGMSLDVHRQHFGLFFEFFCFVLFFSSGQKFGIAVIVLIAQFRF